MTSIKIIGLIFAALVLFAILAILVPVLLSAKSTIAVIAGILIIVTFIGVAVTFAVKQFIKSIKEN